MATYGLLTTGFSAKTYNVILAEIHASFRESFGNSINLSANSVFGQVSATMAEKYAELWELAEEVDAAMDPDEAVGAQLDAVCTLTGITRKPASSSTVTFYLTGDDGTVVPAGSKGSVTGSAEQFSTQTAETLVLATAWVTATAYVVGDVRSSDTAIWYCSVAGTSGTAPLTSGLAQGDTIADGTATWIYVGDGLAYDTSPLSKADNTGPVAAAIHGIVTIETAVSGWTSILNIAAATLGEDVETDADLRERRDAEITTPGTSSIPALLTDAKNIDDVTDAFLFVNNTDVTDAKGVPPHAVELIIQGGLDQDIADFLLANVAAGVATYGSSSETSTDSEGTVHTMLFTRPTLVPIYADVLIDYDAAQWPATGGEDAVEAEIVRVGNLREVGWDVKSWQITNTLGTLGIGIHDLSTIDMAITPSPSGSTDITIDDRELATFDVANVNCTSQDTTP